MPKNRLQAYLGNLRNTIASLRGIRDRTQWADYYQDNSYSPGAMQEKTDNLGEQGAPAQNSSTKKFEIYIPLEGNERTESGEAGKGTAIQKKG